MVRFGTIARWRRGGGRAAKSSTSASIIRGSRRSNDRAKGTDPYFLVIASAKRETIQVFAAGLLRCGACWGGRPPTASVCQNEVVADLKQGSRPWRRLSELASIRRSAFF